MYNGEPFPGAFTFGPNVPWPQNDSPCPCCGYCRHCGRANAHPIYIPPTTAPAGPYPVWIVAPVTTSAPPTLTTTTTGTNC